MNKHFEFLLLLIIIIIPMIVKADLTTEQEEAIASFATNLVIKQSEPPHTDSNGFPLIAYNMGGDARNSGYAGNLIMFSYDAMHKNLINGMKWPFDCASWASFVYNHVLDVTTTLSGGRPFTVSRFLNNALSEKDFYIVARNISVNDIGLAKKGDLVIIEGSHIMIYVGDGQISHVSTSAIVKGGSLGAEIIGLSDRFPGNIVTVIRLKGTNKTPNTLLTWPDTKKQEDLGPKDDPPNIVVNHINNTGFVKEGSIIISFNDDKLLTHYSISINKDEYKWQAINQKYFTINYIAKSNATYYINVKDSKNQITKQTFVISNIDKTPPSINSINFQYNGDETYTVTIEASDNNNISYILDNIDYKSNNTFNNLSLTKHNLLIKDDAENITNYTIDLTENNVPLFDIIYENDYKKKETIVVIPKNSSNIYSYAVKNTEGQPTTWKKFQDNIKIEIEKNDIYYIWLKSKNNINYYKKISIDNIDNIPPIIESYKINNISKNNFSVTIIASDSCDIEYSIVNGEYQTSNIFTNLEKKSYSFLVRDCVRNVSLLNINSNEFIDQYEDDTKTSDKVTNDNNSLLIDTILLIIIIVISIIIIINVIKIVLFKQKRR